MVLADCQLNPLDSVNWSGLVSLSISGLKLTDNVMEKILSGCPNLECLELESFWGLYRLEISSLKLRKLSLINWWKETDGNAARWLEILVPHVQELRLEGCRDEMRLQLTNVESLVSALVNCNFYGHNDEDREASLKELLHRLVHVKNLSLGPCCIEFLSILEERGWQSPASSRKSLKIKTTFYQQHFSPICNLLQSSSKLETLVIDWRRALPKDILEPMEKDKISKMFEKHVLDSSLLHLRTIKIITFCGPLSAQKCILPLVKHLLKNAKVLEKMVIDAYSNNESDVSGDFAEMAQECLSFPRSSQNAVVVFSY